MIGVGRMRCERGAAAAETALLLPVLLALVGAVAFAGWLGTVRTIIDHGARAGARFAAVPGGEDLRIYPDEAAVFGAVDDATPMITPSSVRLVSSSSARNAPVSVEVTYEVANPVGALLAPIGVDASTITVVSRAEVRRE